MKATKKKTQLHFSPLHGTHSVVHIFQSVSKVDQRFPKKCTTPVFISLAQSSVKWMLMRTIVARRRLLLAETLLEAEDLLIEAVVFIAVLCESLL